MDIYTVEERNNMIKQAMDNYKYKDLDLKIGDVFAIHKKEYFTYKVVSNKSRLRIIRCLPESIALGFENEAWSMVEDRHLKDLLDYMSNSKEEAENRYNLYMLLKGCNCNDYVRIILKTLNNIVQDKYREINIAVYYSIIDNFVYSYSSDTRKMREHMEEILYIKNIIKGLIGG